MQAFAFSRSGLSRGGGGLPVEFVIGGTDYDQLADWRDIILERAESYPGLTRLDSDLKETGRQLFVPPRAVCLPMNLHWRLPSKSIGRYQYAGFLNRAQSIWESSFKQQICRTAFRAYASITVLRNVYST